MYLIVRTATDGGVVYWHTNDELQAFVQACVIAYEYAEEIESPTERLAFHRQLKQAVNVDNETRREALRQALLLYTQYNGGTEVEIIPVDDYCKGRVLPEDIVNDLDLEIERCLRPAQEEQVALQQQASLESELERQAAMRDGETVIQTRDLLPTENPFSVLDDTETPTTQPG